MPTIEQARAWYQGADSVHDFEHVLRVYATAEALAEKEHADLEIVRAAALLHDVEGSAPGGEERGSHHLYSADFAGRVLAEEGWPAERVAAVQHCIRAHRFRGDREPPATLEAQVIFDADKLDVIGAVGTARTIAYATIAGEPLYCRPSERFRQTGKEEPGEHHSAYHEYLFKLSHVQERLFTPAARAMAHGRHAAMVAFFEQLASEMEGER